MEQKERNKKTRKIRKNSTVRKKIKNVIEIDLSLATVQSSGNECSMNVSTDQPNRINTINNVFQTLRKCIPTFPYERRLSKIDTLHLTISYIHLLQSIIHSDLTLFDYLCQTLDYLINNSNNNSVSCRFVKPLWATSGEDNFYFFKYY